MTNKKMKFETEEDFLSLNSSEDDHESDADDVLEKYYREDDNEDLGESSDSAPETVSFKIEKEKSRQLKQEKSEVIKLNKNLIKKKRKEIHLRNVAQKEVKKKNLISKKLPDELLEVLDQQSDDLSDSEINLGSCENVKKETMKCDIKNSKSKVKNLEKIGTHGTTLFKLHTLPKDLKKRQYASPEYQSMFFRGRVRREKNTQALLSKQEKRMVRKMTNVTKKS